jgi:Flp pilus assembly pilin Flp
MGWDLNNVPYGKEVIATMKSSTYRENGQGLIEYALILVLIAIVTIAGLQAAGPRINRIYLTIAYQLQNPSQEIIGPPVSVSSINVAAAADCNPITHACTNVTATATVTLVDDTGISVSAAAHVMFTHSGSSTTVVGNGTVASGNLGNGVQGDSVQACVVAVTGHELNGGGCASATY